MCNDQSEKLCFFVKKQERNFIVILNITFEGFENENNVYNILNRSQKTLKDTGHLGC